MVNIFCIGVFILVIWEKILGKQFLLDEDLNIWVMVNCQLSSELQQDIIISVIMILFIFGVNICVKVRLNGVVEFVSFIFGIILVIMLVEMI